MRNIDEILTKSLLKLKTLSLPIAPIIHTESLWFVCFQADIVIMSRTNIMQAAHHRQVCLCHTISRPENMCQLKLLNVSKTMAIGPEASLRDK